MNTKAAIAAFAAATLKLITPLQMPIDSQELAQVSAARRLQMPHRMDETG